MKKNPKNPKRASLKEDPTTKKNDELGEGELNEVTGGGCGSNFSTVGLGLRKSAGGNTGGTF